jgi:tight adherence protein C
MELDQALQVVSSKLSNPMGDELQRVLLDRQVGFSQAVAFRRLAERVELDDVRLLAISVAQAEELGQPMVPVMQNQSRHVRLARRRYAEAEAYRAPVKMMFPMTLFILPALFIVVLAPAGLKVAESMFR